MSYNDPKWSVFWSRGSSKSAPPDKDNLWTGKHVGQDSVVTRAKEIVGYIVIETGHDTSDGIEIETRRGSDIAMGIVDGSYNYAFSVAFEIKPAVAVLSQVAMDDSDGSWAVLAEISSATSMQVAVDEDIFQFNDRTHESEELAYIVFSVVGVVELIAPTPSMEFMVVNQVPLDTTWKTVQLSETYWSPIAVCTILYNTNTDLIPAVVRMQNVGPFSFEIRLQNPKEIASSLSRDVHCVVVEEGAWTMPDGRTIEANRYESTKTDRDFSWVGQKHTYLNGYTNPIVLGQVMSYNDPKWSVFWSRGSSKSAPPDKNNLWTGKHVGEDTTVNRDDETVGYIVIEMGHDTSDDIEIETGRGPELVEGYVEGSYTYEFDHAFDPLRPTPAVAVLSQVAMIGEDGSWAVLAEISSTTSIQVAVDEDQIDNNERNHEKETVDYVVFAYPGVVQLVL
jgi:hypothetical protein